MLPELPDGDAGCRYSQWSGVHVSRERGLAKFNILLDGRAVCLECFDSGRMGSDFRRAGDVERWRNRLAELELVMAGHRRIRPADFKQRAVRRTLYFRNHKDWIVHLAVRLSIGQTTGDVKKADSADLRLAREFLKTIGVRIPGESNT